MQRIIFTIIKFFRYRSCLKKPEFTVDQIILLNLEYLKQKNILALILDFDGVLGSHGKLQPLPEVVEWLERAVQIFGPKKIFVLSNNPLASRRDFFEQYFNNQIEFIIAKPKPNLEGIITIFNDLLLFGSIEKSQVLLIDDRLATGILAAKIFGIASCLIMKPYVNLRGNWIKELFFMFLRKLERIIVWHL